MPETSKGKGKAEDFRENATSAEKWAIRPVTAPRTNDTGKEPGAREDTVERGAKEDSKEKTKESGK